MNTHKLSIIVPAYNEEKTVGEIIRRLLVLQIDGWTSEVIVVNDASTDNTRNVLDGFLSGVKAINLPKNGGKGSAIRAGLKEATGDFAVIQDADLECKPEEIPLLIRALGDISLGNKIAVMGSREIHEGNKKVKSLSGMGSRFITFLINFLWGASLTDTLMCYKLFPRETFEYFNAGRFEAEMLFIARLLQNGYKIVEVPVTYNPRQEGKKIQYSDGIMIILRLIRFRITGK